MPPRKYTAGLDLGQASDYSALAVVERVGDGPGPAYHVRYLRRFPLGTSYPDVVAAVAATLATPPLPADAILAIDRTGVGRAVFDLFRAPKAPREAGGSVNWVDVRPPRLGPVVPPPPPPPPSPVGVPTFGVTITAGAEARRDGRDWLTPKRDLVGAVSVGLQSGRLKIAPGLPEAATLAEELRNFRVKIGASGHDSYGAGGDALEWRDRPHDDLVLAVAIAVWAAEHIHPRPRGEAWSVRW